MTNVQIPMTNAKCPVVGAQTVGFRKRLSTTNCDHLLLDHWSLGFGHSPWSLVIVAWSFSLVILCGYAELVAAMRLWQDDRLRNDSKITSRFWW